jgi:hypothetical protein
MKIELLYSDGCPHYQPFADHLEELVRNGTLPGEIQHIRIETQEQAEERRFLGSPTLRVNGEDVDARARARTDFGLQCRVRVPPLPPVFQPNSVRSPGSKTRCAPNALPNSPDCPRLAPSRLETDHINMA